MAGSSWAWPSGGSVRQELEARLGQRLLVLDGAMGTMVQRLALDEGAFRGRLLAAHRQPLQGNNDILVLTQPAAIRAIHAAYLAAGADCIETNTFAATRIAQADYGLSHLAYQINYEAAQLAKQACDEFRRKGDMRFVCGALGPTNRTLRCERQRGLTVTAVSVRFFKFLTFLSAFYVEIAKVVYGAKARGPTLP